MKRIALISIFALLAILPAAAQDKPKADAAKEGAKAEAKPAAAAPTVDEILTRFVKASGGKEAIEKVSSRAAKGSFEIEAMNMTGTIEMYAKAPNKNAMVIELPGLGKIYGVYDGVKGYSTDPMSGVRELSGTELAAMKRQSDFYRDLNLKQHFPKIVVKGKEKVGAAETYVLEATPAEGAPEKWYFDVATGLMVRQDGEEDSPQGKMTYEAYMEDYRDVDGIKTPFTIRRVTPAFAMSIKLTEIKQNVTIDDTKFNKPSGQ
ncbi:MAG: hypothetical protein SF339_28940 [Blastocatellia bacterium]|nr:hypothetical protein [Blastocatellia bacterium]